MLEKIKQELENSGFDIAYSDDDVIALQQLKDVNHTVQGDVDTAVVLEYLTEINKLGELEDIKSNTSHPLRSAVIATFITMQHKKNFAFSTQGVRDLLGGFVDGQVITETQKNELLDKGKYQEYPFANATLRLVKMARGKCEPAKPITWNRQQHLKIMLNEDLPEPITPYLTKTNSAWTDEPIGKTKVLQKAGDYTISLKDVVDSGTLSVALDITSNFTVELI